MKFNTVINSKGEPQASKIVISIEGSGGETGKHAVVFLARLIESIKETETEQQVVEYYYIIAGCAICCKECGFLSEGNLDDLMHLVEHIVDNELIRVRGAETAE